MVGPLGAGKTQLVKGIALGNGLTDDASVTSPTFTLVNEYEGRLRMYHLDAYRLTSPNELVALGFDEMMDKDSMVVVGWADRVASVMPEDTLWIKYSASGETSRDLAWFADGPMSNSVLDKLRSDPDMAARRLR